MANIYPSTPFGFRQLSEYPGYAVNASGDVISCRKRLCPGYGGGAIASFATKWHKLNQFFDDKRGYATVTVRNGRGGHCVQVGHLILLAFVGECPKECVVCHANDIALDNRLENLRWGTHADNIHDSMQNGRHVHGESSPRAKLTETAVKAILARSAIGERQADLAREYGVHKGTVGGIVNRRTWKYLDNSGYWTQKLFDADKEENDDA